MRTYPVCLLLDGVRCLVVGGGTIARQKVEALLPSGARCRVIALEASEPIRELAVAGRIELLTRAFEVGDLDGIRLVIAATNDRGQNARIAEAARERGILINAVDDPPMCNFIAPSVMRRGDFTISVSTGGASPALAARVRGRLEELFGPEYGEYTAHLARLRDRIVTRFPDPEERKAAWYRLVDADLLDLLRAGDLEGMRDRLDEILG